MIGEGYQAKTRTTSNFRGKLDFEMGRGGFNEFLESTGGTGLRQKMSAVESHLGHTWPTTSSRSVEVPSLDIQGRSFYPSPFDSADEVGPKIWKLLVTEGRVLDSTRLRTALGKKSKDGETVRPMGDPELRFQVLEQIVRHRIPYTPYSPLGGKKKCYGIARNRKEIESYISILEGRVAKMKKAGRLVAMTKEGFDLDDFGPGWKAPEGFSWPEDRVGELLEELKETKMTNSQIGEFLGEKSRIRELIHELREASVPIVGRSGGVNGGYYLAETKEELQTWLLGHRERGKRVQERIDALKMAAVIWYPKEDEQEESLRLKSKPFLFDPSMLAGDRATAKAAREKTRDEDRRLKEQANRDLADVYMDQLKANGLEEAEHRIGYNLNPTKEDFAMQARAREIRKFKKTGKKPRGGAIWEAAA